MTELASMRIGVVGTGLMGASVAIGAARLGAHVRGYDVDAAALEQAVARGAVHTPCASLAEAVADVDVAVVATPVSSLSEVVAAVLDATGDATTVTDVGSTKATVCAAAASPRFVGGHPVCGSEAQGATHASADIFDGATWFLTPLAETDPARYRLVHGLVSSLRAQPVAIEPGAHDALVAITSHLPHALANLVVNQAGTARIGGHEPLAAAGGSLRDLSRVAGANPRVWVDIFLDNREALLSVLAEHRLGVERLEAALSSADADAIGTWIEEAAGNRRRVLRAAYAADPGDLFRVRIHVPDEPGVLARVTQALGAERLNIEDFELHHLSPERGGVLGIFVSGEGEAERAAELLEGLGYGVVVAPVAAGP